MLTSEIDKFANQAYEVLYGEPTAGDITKIDAKDVPDHDILVGGFPCQAFSVAGKRGGFNDARGTLFFEAARIADEKQPKMLLLENVKGLVGHDKGKTLDTMVKVLNDIGYTVDFQVLNSKYFGVPQNRERIFIIALRDDLVNTEEWNIKGNNVVAKGKKRISKYEGVKTFNFDWPTNDTVTTKLRDILENDVDERYYLSEEKTAKLVEQLENVSEKTVCEERVDEGLRLFKGNICGTVRTVSEGGDKRLIEPMVKSVGNTNPSGNGMNGQVYDSEGLSPTLTTNKGEGTKITEVRSTLTPDRIEKRQNGRRFKENDEEMFTLTSQDRHGVMFTQNKLLKETDVSNTLQAAGPSRGLGNNNPITGVVEKPKYRIRKLTPLECWRLQGFTDEQHNAVEAAGISNSQRYKQAGNAVTVNVIESVGERLLLYLS